MSAPLTQEQGNSFIEKIGRVFDVAIFTEADANRLLSLARGSIEWEAATKESLTPLFHLYNLETGKENLDALVHNVSVSKGLADAVTGKLTGLGLPVNVENVNKLGANNGECMSYTAPFPREFYILDEVRTLRPEYLIGTWFNRKNRPFKLNMELDWVNRLSSINGPCFLPETPTSMSFFSSTGENIWDLISEVHVHPTAMKEFTRPRDGWIEAPSGGYTYKREPDDSPLNFIERMITATESRTIVALKSGTGGWATFEHVRNSEVTAAAARLLFKFSDPLYCARSDGKVVIKLKDYAPKITFTNEFPSGRTLVNNQNKFPVCIE